MIIKINDGKITEVVATNAPETPPVIKPANVATFTPTGPGVIEDTAICLLYTSGASKGIGNAIAHELQNIGEVFVTGRNEKALVECNAKGFCVCDLSKDITTLTDFIEKNNIDVLINNAGAVSYTHLNPSGVKIYLFSPSA